MGAGRGGAGRAFSEKKSVFRWCLGARRSEHTKTFGVGDGFQQSLSQLLLAAVLGQQQHVKASVRCR